MNSSRPDLVNAKRCLRGVAIGDSLGLVYEGLRASRGLRMYPFPVRQRLLFGRGMVSDDATQSGLVLSALIGTEGDLDAFQKRFGGFLRRWFLSVPPGVGLATIRACSRLCFGISPGQSGVNSAGNGAAMRAAVIGAALYDDLELCMLAVERCSVVTHRHPDAIAGAKLIALATALCTRGESETFQSRAEEVAPGWRWDDLGPESGPTGYVVFSVNAALKVWREAQSWQDAMERVIRIGGDTDTIGAMAGGIIAVAYPEWEIPEGWLDYAGFPTASDLARLESGYAPGYFRLLGFHLFMLPVVLFHGFRRLFPPY